MLYNYQNTIVIAEALSRTHNGLNFVIKSFEMDPSGNITVWLPSADFSPNGLTGMDFAKIIDHIQHLTFEDLNAIHAEYTYKETGLAMNIIDSFVSKGEMSYSDSASLKNSVQRNLGMALFSIRIGLRNHTSRRTFIDLYSSIIPCRPETIQRIISEIDCTLDAYTLMFDSGLYVATQVNQKVCAVLRMCIEADTAKMHIPLKNLHTIIGESNAILRLCEDVSPITAKIDENIALDVKSTCESPMTLISALERFMETVQEETYNV